MRPGGGKQKGSNFEREVCKLLSLWISYGKNQDLFWRSSISGGRATMARRKGRSIKASGDICATSPEGHLLTDLFFIECKHVKKLGLDSFLLKGKGPLADFWKKAVQQAEDHELSPMLIAKENGAPIIIVTNPGDLQSICQQISSLTNFPEIRLFNHVLSEQFQVRYRRKDNG